MEGMQPVIAVKEGKVENQFKMLVDGLQDNKLAFLNRDKILWIERFDKYEHESNAPVFLATFEGNKRIMLFRHLSEEEKASLK